MKLLKSLIPLFLIAGAVLFYFLFIKNGNINVMPKTQTPQTPFVTIKNIDIEVSVARTPSEKEHGLSGTERLGEYQGMIFEFIPKSKPNFWMKDMLIPLDLIWIDGGKIVKIDKNVPNPEANTPDSRLKLYSPNSPVDYVLEVNAGFSDKNGIVVGDSVTFSL